MTTSLDFADDGTVLEFFVPGIPAPGGSKRFMGLGKRTGRAILIDAGGQRTKDWRACVGLAGSLAAKVVLQGPLELTCVFTMPRPKYHFHTGKAKRGQLREDAPQYHTTKPDTTKLLRSTEDALKGITWLDDSQVARQHGIKTYGPHPGCLIRISTL